MASITLRDLEANFPGDVKMPDALVNLVAYASSHDGFYAGNFELYAHGRSELLYWFEDSQTAISQLAPFGCNSDGSLYALWLYRSRDSDLAPVVFLGSEGIGNKVLAGNIIEFIQLLTLGVDDFGFVVEQPNWHIISARRDASLFQGWASKKLGIEAPKEPHRLVSAAQSAHPDFNAWVNNHSHRRI